MTDHRGEGFPTSGNDRSQRAWTSCPFWLSLSPPVKELPESCFSFPCHSGLSGILLFIRPHLMYLTKKDSRQAGITNQRGEGFPTSGNDRSQRAWTSCSFWLSLSLPVKNRQDPSSPCHSGLSRILLFIRPHLMCLTKKDSRQAGMTDHRVEGFPTSGNDRSQSGRIPDKRE